MADQKRRDIVPVNEVANEREARGTRSAKGEPKHGEISRQARERSESGEPGGGAGRRDEVGPTGVYPYSADERPKGQAELRRIGEWAGGDRGIAGYEDSGGSELSTHEGELIGGLTSDASGRPTIDTHGSDAGRKEAEGARRKKRSSRRGKKGR